MKFYIENLGKIEKANIELKDLTIICGPNSTNKTWLSYFINHSLHTIRYGLANVAMNISDELNEEIVSLINKGEGYIDLEKYHYIFNRAFDICECTALENLHSHFNLSSKTFSDTNFKLVTDFNISKDEASLTVKERVKLKKEANSNLAKISLNINNITQNKINNTLFRLLLKRDIYTGLAELYSFSSNLNPFVITSERTGCMVFQPEIDHTTIKAKDILSELGEISELESLPSKLIESLETLSNGEQHTYSSPIKNNMKVIREASVSMREDSFITRKHPEVLESMSKINGGSFTYTDSQLMFTTTDKSNTLPVSISSSSIKSLFLLDLYVRSLAKPNDLLLIDEPELNLHPDNQRLMARVIARIVNSGVKVLITTHSDYLIREINNSIMLSNEFDEKEAIMQSHDFKEADILKPSQVSAYMVENEGSKALVSDMKVGPLGINTQIFDSIINNANQLQSEIYFNLDDIDE